VRNEKWQIHDSESGSEADSEKFKSRETWEVDSTQKVIHLMAIVHESKMAASASPPYLHMIQKKLR
jgi:hypothetical protein